ncbi:hypothetical protein A306_00003385 [Columba livia]|uniref:GrpE protein homolog n=1 Tax=Columba livia TaxID=8932 RepID=A0A2I0MM77_COLLI|nr:hypothetical protein A306_00003385 [Columba livia]
MSELPDEIAPPVETSSCQFLWFCPELPASRSQGSWQELREAAPPGLGHFKSLFLRMQFRICGLPMFQKADTNSTTATRCTDGTCASPAPPAATPIRASPSATRGAKGVGQSAPHRSAPEELRAPPPASPVWPEACIRLVDWSSAASLLAAPLTDWRRSRGARAEARYSGGTEGAFHCSSAAGGNRCCRQCACWGLLQRTSPRLLCVATQQKNTGQNLEEDQSQSQNEQKVEPSSAEKMLHEEKTKLEEQLKEVTEKYKRALADAENVRQRSQKLVEEAKLYGIQSFCKDLLEVADILEKATESVPKEEIKDENPHLKSLYEGLVMTEVQIQKVFKKHGLLRLNPVGAKFDPYEHEALFHAPVEGQEPGTIALVSKIGYKLHGRTLRPALVGVVKEA